MFLLRLGRKLHSLGLQRFGGCEDVVRPECDGLKSADAIFVAFGSEQDELRFGAGDAEFDPALRSKGLVGHHAKAEFFGVEL
jgi:hypothetical protein